MFLNWCFCRHFCRVTTPFVAGHTSKICYLFSGYIFASLGTLCSQAVFVSRVYFPLWAPFVSNFQTEKKINTISVPLPCPFTRLLYFAHPLTLIRVPYIPSPLPSRHSVPPSWLGPFHLLAFLAQSPSWGGFRVVPFLPSIGRCRWVACARAGCLALFVSWWWP